MKLEIVEPGTKPRPGVLLAVEHGTHSAKALQLQTLTSRGIAPVMAKVLAPFVWGGQVNG